MPELPEVEHGRRVAEAVAVGRTITRVHCAVDPIVFEGVSTRRIRAVLRGAKVLAAARWGKFVWLELDRRPWPLFHFGMTGAFLVPEGRALVLAGGPTPRVTTWPPRFWKLWLEFEDGGELVMVNARRLGRIRLRNDPRAEPPVSVLGFDPYLNRPRLSAFRALLAARKTILKALLLDQTFAAGVGNWVADEVLYQARLDPRRNVTTLTTEEVARLHKALGTVVHEAVRVNAMSERFPKDWLFHRRWGKAEGARTLEGQAIAFATVAGRATAWVPAVQR
jgi:formamidopyrimidine-DNA glycosylase